MAEVVSGGSLSEKIHLATNWCIVDALINKAGRNLREMHLFNF
jgi:hypothetical protein